MAKLHELLAAEKTPNAAMSEVLKETIKKFKNRAQYYDGQSKSLKMIEDGPESESLEAQARVEKAVPTTVLDTLAYAMNIYAKAEQLQVEKNCTSATAKADVYLHGNKIFTDVPVGQLLGMEDRLGKIKGVFLNIPTLDSSRHWQEATAIGNNIWEIIHPEETTKTQKVPVPIVLAEATDKHPAQVNLVSEDKVVGKFTTIHRTGACPSWQKAEAIKLVDDLIVEIKKARIRANTADVVEVPDFANELTAILLKPFKF